MKTQRVGEWEKQRKDGQTQKLAAACCEACRYQLLEKESPFFLIFLQLMGKYLNTILAWKGMDELENKELSLGRCVSH
jgi:hypothetical protein